MKTPVSQRIQVFFYDKKTIGINDIYITASKGEKGRLAWKFLSRNDVCLRQMMLPAVMMSLTLMMCATHILPANIASLRQELPLHHFGFSRYIIGALHQHHFYLFAYFHSLCVKESGRARTLWNWCTFPFGRAMLVPTNRAKRYRGPRKVLRSKLFGERRNKRNNTESADNEVLPQNSIFSHNKCVKINT